MSTRGKVRLFILFAFLLYCAIASVVDAGDIETWYAPGWQPHDALYLIAMNTHPFDTYEYLFTVYDGDFQFVTSVYAQVPPGESFYDESHGWCSEIGGLAMVKVERLDSEPTTGAWVMPRYEDPCDGDPFFRSFLPILGS